MNRLILIGNGFDLAHGSKTGYKDFILWYLTRCFTVATSDRVYGDELIRIDKAYPQDPINYGNKTYTVPEMIDFFYDRGFEDLIYNRTVKVPGWQNHYEPVFKVIINSYLLERLLLTCSKAGWIDIENEFYLQLKVILHNKDHSDKIALLNILNNSLRVLIDLLKEYLSGLPEIEVDEKYYDIVQSDILKNDIATVHLKKDEPRGDVYVLNFNYTGTAKQYFLEEHNWGHEVNYIHGSLDDPHNPLIFGFGDELDEDYLKMEHEQIAEYFAYIKSFWYFKTSNYHDLIRFTDSGMFQVVILGHSCGLSDRTMLNMIFEHDNCKSIKIYYHELNGKNNFTALTQEISRHFRNKGMMRKKITPFNRSSPMPQVKA